MHKQFDLPFKDGRSHSEEKKDVKTNELARKDGDVCLAIYYHWISQNCAIRITACITFCIYFSVKKKTSENCFTGVFPTVYSLKYRLRKAIILLVLDS